MYNISSQLQLKSEEMQEVSQIHIAKQQALPVLINGV